MNSRKKIEQQLLVFLRDILEEEQFDYIIPVERKGTAVLRALMQEIEEPRLKWDWRKVLSHAAIDFSSHVDLKGKKVLLFDELVHHGDTLKKAKETIESRCPTSVMTAGFAVYEKCKKLPDMWFYGSLDGKAYEVLRDDIVEMLQRYGSLLLDTEHLELKIKVKCGLDEFFAALAQAGSGKTYAFTSGADRINLTITNPRILSEERLRACLPSKSSMDEVVQKCRILESPYPSEFSILPICYPNISGEVDDDWLKRVPAYLTPQMLKCATGKQLFYVVGLLSAIEILRTIIAALSELKSKGKILMDAPSENFAHLAVMFPTLDIDEFRAYILDMMAHPAKLKKDRSSVRQTVDTLDEPVTTEISGRIINGIMSLVDERTTAEYEEGCSKLPVGVTCKEIIGLAQDEFKIEPAKASTAMDALIDAGILVTRVEQICDSDNSSWFIRTFMPDGEIVTSRIRRIASVRGRELKCLA